MTSVVVCRPSNVVVAISTEAEVVSPSLPEPGTDVDWVSAAITAITIIIIVKWQTPCVSFIRRLISYYIVKIAKTVTSRLSEFEYLLFVTHVNY